MDDDRIDETGQGSGLYLPGLRHCGRAIVLAQLDRLDTVAKLKPDALDHLIRLLSYYRSVPPRRSSAYKNGLFLLSVGRPSLHPDAFQLVQQLINHGVIQVHPIQFDSIRSNWTFLLL